jgi:DNA-binding NtrC family response regulator
MKKHSAIKGSATVCETVVPEKLTVLSISPVEEDHLALEAILGHSTTVVFKARDINSALMLLQKHDIAVVLCERDLVLGTWIDVLEHINPLPIPPSLIVTSRLADEQFWAEALNLGAWDVLVSHPFVRDEVIRCVESGWRHWENQPQTRAAAMRTLAAAS